MKGPAIRGAEAGRRAAAGSLSVAAFRLLFADAAPAFARAGVEATLGTVVGSRRAPGPTWISVTSPWAQGRLIRRADGSFDCDAHRVPGGEPLCSEHGQHVRPEHLDRLLAAVAGPHSADASTRTEGEA